MPIIFISPLPDHPRYELHYSSAWPVQGKIWSKISDRYLKDRFSPAGYAHCTLYGDRGKSEMSIHRLLIRYFKPEEWNPALVTNHKDYNRANNNLENLEMVTARMNSSDHDRSLTSSKYLGVHWYKAKKKWRAKIDGRTLGTFTEEVEAAKAVDRYLIDKGIDSRLNNVNDD